MNIDKLKKIYLTGGCFWGIQAYFSKVEGVVDTLCGYANGNFENPTYEEVCSGESGFAEAVMVEYDTTAITLENILARFFDIIDPTTLNRQGFDTGSQYRSAIYYTDKNDGEIINNFIKSIAKDYKDQIVVEVSELENFYPAEDYHQNYLDKNPNGYCHIDLSKVDKYKRPDDFVISKNLSALQYNVTQKNATEPAFSSPYNDNFEKGIYVDIVSGEPLFLSSEKFDCGCGWPAFKKPIKDYFLKYKQDKSLGMDRIEVRSAHANSHLGHVFDDGPGDLKRYCINGSALKFIPYEEMEKEGYRDYINYLE